MEKRSAILSGFFLVLSILSQGQQPKLSKWHGFEKLEFSFEERNAYIVVPEKKIQGNPWIWRAYFPDWHYEMDSILVSKGFYIAYINCADMYGSPSAMMVWDKFYRFLLSEYSFSEKPVLEGVSRGGLYIYGWAKRNPDKVSFIYAEAPVLDLKSWPGGKGKGRGNIEEWKKCLSAYRLSEDQMLLYNDNPFDNIESLVSYKIPVIHVVCLSDSIVPVAENTLVMEERIKQMGGNISIDVMTENISLQGHHFKINKPAYYADRIFSSVIPVKEVLSSESFIEFNCKLNNTFSKIHNKKELTVAFLGGSITYNKGWRNKICQYLQETYPGTQFNFISAGIPSLGSLAHAFRLKSDVLNKGNIDLLFIEAAVNDHANGTEPVIQLRAMEGIIRHALISDPSMNIVLMSFADEDKNKNYETDTEPGETKVHRLLAEYYCLPFINLSKEVYERMKQGEFTWKDDFKNLHPSPYGQNIYFQTIKSMFQHCEKKYNGESVVLAKIPDVKNKIVYDNGDYIDVSKAIKRIGFTLTENWAPADNKETREGFVHVPVLESSVAGSSFILNFTGTVVGMAVLSGPDAGSIEYKIDNGKKTYLNLKTKWSNSLHLPWYLMLADGLKNGKHILEVKTASDRNKSGGSACRIVHFLVNR